MEALAVKRGTTPDPRRLEEDPEPGAGIIEVRRMVDQLHELDPTQHGLQQLTQLLK